MEDPFASVVGQPIAVECLRGSVAKPVHAYLFVGPAGSGKRAAARAFAAALLDDDRALVGTHPDVITVEREGASINVAQAREISRLAVRSPSEGNRKVLILTDFHLVDEAAPALLKTIEEASATTIFIVLADKLTKELVTVASRCVKVEFFALSAALVEQTLLSEGVDADRARQAADSAHGSLDRARLLAVDDAVAARRDLWLSVPASLDGRGATAARLADDVVAALDHASEPLLARQAEEQATAKARSKETGLSVGAAKTLEAQYKREQRRVRTDELRSGFATLSMEYGKKMNSVADAASAASIRQHLESVDWANRSLEFNPNEVLLLQGLFVRLSKV